MNPNIDPPRPAPAPPPAPEPDQAAGVNAALMTEIESKAAALDDEKRQRLWIQTITRLLKERAADADRSYWVQAALDGVHIAACRRAVRILRADLSAEEAAAEALDAEPARQPAAE